VSIDERIAEALDAAEIGASELADLVSEVETAARNHALDPMVVDPTAARAAMNDAEFTRDRLQTALPQLQARLREVGAAERYRTWAAEYDEVAAEQTALAQELTGCIRRSSTRSSTSCFASRRSTTGPAISTTTSRSASRLPR
jgi:hypothetical protein